MLQIVLFTNSTGFLDIRSDEVHIDNAANDEKMAQFTADGSVDLYYNNVKKFETTANGIVVTGSTISNGIVSITDNNSDISPDNSGSGHLRIDGNGYKAAIALDADGVNLYSTSAAKPLIFGVNETEVARVTTTGMNVTGTLDVSGGADVTGVLDLSSHLDMPDAAQIKLGNDDDFILQHITSGSVSSIQGEAIRIRNLAGTETMASFNADGSTNLFYNGNAKLATTNDGIDITGIVNLDSDAVIKGGTATAITLDNANVTIAGNTTVKGTLSVGSLDTSNQTVRVAIN